MKTVYLSLGSNLGSREAALQAALDQFQTRGGVIRRVSSVYETEPVDFRSQPWFLNLVAEAQTSLFPMQLLDRVRRIEQFLGRQRHIDKGPRIIDIDILFYGASVIRSSRLVVPHPRLADRRFVLAPMAELAPGLIHPVLRRTIKELLADLSGQAVRTVEFVPVLHYIPTYGLSIIGSKKFGFSSDSGYCPQLIQIAQNTDLFLCNVGRCLGAEIASLWGHMLPEEAGKVAKEAGAKRLIITHFWPKCNKALSLEKASNAFGRQAELAEIHHTFEF